MYQPPACRERLVFLLKQSQNHFFLQTDLAVCIRSERQLVQDLPGHFLGLQHSCAMNEGLRDFFIL